MRSVQCIRAWLRSLNSPAFRQRALWRLTVGQRTASGTRGLRYARGFFAFVGAANGAASMRTPTYDGKRGTPSSDSSW